MLCDKQYIRRVIKAEKVYITDRKYNKENDRYAGKLSTHLYH